MQWRRTFRHLILPPGTVRRCFPEPALAAIEEAIRDSERRHGGELVFAVEGSLDLPSLWRDVTARERALDVFSQLRVWDTAANNGVLLYVLLAEHAVEIVADRGLAGIPEPAWADVCHRMRDHLAAGRHEQGVAAGIAAASELIAGCFPATDRDELSNRPVLL